MQHNVGFRPFSASAALLTALTRRSMSTTVELCRVLAFALPAWQTRLVHSSAYQTSGSTHRLPIYRLVISPDAGLGLSESPKRSCFTNQYTISTVSTVGHPSPGAGWTPPSKAECTCMQLGCCCDAMVRSPDSRIRYDVAAKIDILPQGCLELGQSVHWSTAS